MTSELAILGGKPAITVIPVEHSLRPAKVVNPRMVGKASGSEAAGPSRPSLDEPLTPSEVYLMGLGIEQWRRPVGQELALINDLLEKGEVSAAGTGISKEVEDEFARFVGARYCLSVDHGTNALWSAYYAVGVGPGDEVITPVAGYICSYAGALHLGARPVFADIDPKTLLMDPKDVEHKITPRTRAINVVHFGGNICDMDAFLEIGRKHGIPIVEDAAHAHGAEWDGRRIGGFGDISCFSLQGCNPEGKALAGGEGGLVTTNNREYYERQLIYAHLHRAGLPGELTNPAYSMVDSDGLGIKFRSHPLAMALAKVSFGTLEYRIAQSAANRERIFAALRELPGLEPEHSYPKARRISVFGGLKVIYHPEQLGGLPVQRFVAALQAEGAPVGGPGYRYAGATQDLQHLKGIIRARFDLWGRNRGPLGDDYVVPPYGAFPVAEAMDKSLLTIGNYIEPREGFIEQLCAAFRKVTAHYRELL